VGTVVADGEEPDGVGHDDWPGQTRKQRSRMFWLGCGFGAVLLLMGAAAVVPCMGTAKPIAMRRTCINNLRMIESAKEQWALDNQKGARDLPTDAEIYGTKESRGYFKYPPSCPNGGKYVIGALGTEPTCSLAEKGHRVR